MFHIPSGFSFNGVHCGIKQNKKRDIAFFYSHYPAVTSAVFTSNLVKSAAVLVSKKNIEKNHVRAVIANSGCANTSTGDRGMRDASSMCSLAAEKLGLPSGDSVLVASTGIIGKYLPMDRIEKGIKDLCSNHGNCSVNNTAEAIMTTDTVPKIVSSRIKLSGRNVNLLAFAKGSGMIHPDMATFLCFILTDCDISKNMLDKALKNAVDNSLNLLSIDGVTSTNDTLLVMANGSAGNSRITAAGNDFMKFSSALAGVCAEMAKKIVMDGEGATKFIEINIRNADSFSNAKKIAVTIATSPLVKTAMFGKDPNWGRIITSVGSSGVKINPGRVDIYFEKLCVCRNGALAGYDEKKIMGIMKQREIRLVVNLHMGKIDLKYLTCDLTFDYVKINAHYHT